MVLNMTEYDALALYREQEEKDKVSAIEANNGVLTVYFKDGTMEVWKESRWRKKLKKIRGRNDKRKLNN